MSQTQNEYVLAFSGKEIEEISSLPCADILEIDAGLPMPRAKWLAVAMMCMGKARMITDGYYGEDDPAENISITEWAEELEDIAASILNFFQPGDGKF